MLNYGELTMSNKNLVTTPQVPATELTFEDVFEYHEYALRGIKNWEEVALLGRANISVLISKARSHEKSLTHAISSVKGKQELLQGKSGDDFVEMAQEFENPVITDIGVKEGNWMNDLEPLDAASINRDFDATTFNKCGWCKHAGGGSCRYNYHITTHCSLLNDPDETTFNTPCLLHSKTADEVSSEVEIMEDRVQKLLAKREKVRQGIKLLQSLKKDASEKPYLISLRPHDHFNVGDEVIAYVGQWNSNGESEHKSVVQFSAVNPHESVWVPAHVIFGYRHHDGCVSYQALFPIHTNMAFHEGRGGGSGMSRPELMKRSTFNYLQDAVENDPIFFQLWMSNIDKGLNGFHLQTFIADMKVGTTATPPEGWKAPTDKISVTSVEEAERILQCLSADLFETEKEIKSWAKMQLQHVHPDKLDASNDEVQLYAHRQTAAVIEAQDLLLKNFKQKI